MEKMNLIEEATKSYKKLPPEKKLLVLGIMQGIMIEHPQNEKDDKSNKKVECGV